MVGQNHLFSASLQPNLELYMGRAWASLVWVPRSQWALSQGVPLHLMHSESVGVPGPRRPIPSLSHQGLVPEAQRPERSGARGRVGPPKIKSLGPASPSLTLGAQGQEQKTQSQ